jgi:hypothetical protein
MMNDPNLSIEEKKVAFSTFNQLHSMQQVAEANTERQKKEVSDAAANQVMDAIGKGQATPQMIASIYSDPRMQWQTKHTLISIAEHAAGTENEASFAPGYADAYKRILSDNPDEKISDLNRFCT